MDKCKFALINARSLRNKSLFVRNYVDECSLDIVALTETWLTDEDTTSVSELCRDNFTLVHQPRGSARRGGDIGVLFRKTLQLISRVTIDTRASETLSVTLRNAHTSCTTRVVVMYRPPNSCFGTFLDDVSKVLLIAGTHPTETVVCGDFNTKYDDPTCTDAVNLADLLDTAGFEQHVTGATHERGNTLDLVITAKAQHPIFTAVRPTSLITDHYAVECELLLSKPDRLKRHVTYRKYSAINNSSFAADLELFNISADEEDPVALLAGYDTCLRTIVVAHAPLVSRTITVRPMTPWHTNDLTEEKRTLRRAERLWRKSGLIVHRQIFTDCRNTFRTSLKTARSEYYRSEISKAGGNMRLFYSIADSLLGRKVNRPLPEVADESHSALATRFQRSFKEKIESLCHNRSPLPADDMPRVVSTRVDVFESASLSDVNK